MKTKQMTNMDSQPIITENEILLRKFLTQMGPWFHIRLMHYYNITMEHSIEEPSQDTDILHFTFPEGDYSIQFLELKQRADQETLEFLTKHQILPVNGPTPALSSRKKR